MNVNIFYEAVLIIGIILSFLFILGAIMLIIKWQITKWHKTTAIVVKTNEQESKGIIEYCVGGIKYVEESVLTKIVVIDVGDEIDIMYNPKKPREHIVISDMMPDAAQISLMVIGGFGMLIILVYFFFLK